MAFLPFDDDLLHAEPRPGERVLIITRKPTVAPTPELLKDSYLRVVADPPADHARWTVIVDSRSAPPRNDPGTEAALQAARDRMIAVFGRMVVVVRSAVGKLQAKRFQKTEHLAGDMTEALAIAHTPIPEPTDARRD
ncbi:MAG: hypothetical protein RLP09_50040 [Sandaracinaceae bacterium]